MTEEDREKIKNELHEFITLNCIFRCDPTKRYSESLPVGVISSKSPSSLNKYQFYLRRLTHNPKMLQYVSALFFYDILKNIQDESEYPAVQLCGLETSSIPIMIGIQQYASRYGIAINSFSVRKERKSYGLFNFIDGIPTDAPVIVVDDTINSGSTLARVLDVCHYELNLKPAKNMYSIIKFNKVNNDFMRFKNDTFKLNGIFKNTEFATEFVPEWYWLPEDCDLSYNKRPDYR